MATATVSLISHATWSTGSANQTTAIQVENTSHTATAIETYQLDVESTALVRDPFFLRNERSFDPSLDVNHIYHLVNSPTNELRVSGQLGSRSRRYPCANADNERDLAVW